MAAYVPLLVYKQQQEEKIVLAFIIDTIPSSPARLRPWQAFINGG